MAQLNNWGLKQWGIIAKFKSCKDIVRPKVVILLLGLQSIAIFAKISGMRKRNSGVQVSSWYAPQHVAQPSMSSICGRPKCRVRQFSERSRVCQTTKNDKCICVKMGSSAEVHNHRKHLYTRPQLLKFWRHLVVHFCTRSKNAQT